MLKSGQIYQFINNLGLKSIGAFILSIIVISIATHFITLFSGWVSKRYSAQRMLIFEMVPVINFLLYIFGIFTSFYLIFKPSHELLIALIIGICFALGFAIKDIASSFIAGIILLVDKPFQVGDRITFNNDYGEVLKIGLRSVKILTVDENVVTIPNHRFLSDVVNSSSVGEVDMLTTVDIHVPVESDLDVVKNVLEEELRKNQYVKSDSKIIIVAKEMLVGSGAVIIKLTAKCMIKDTRLEKAFQTEFLFNVVRRLKIKVARL